ncbi:sensor histidine kinase [Thermophagus sp. OGC60D27]|uniref:sensor histidine kinase n=1 Tax=Thermophagus sp. OGC60D27 TaxID=3458415 RepID=UPI0040379E30
MKLPYHIHSLLLLLLTVVVSVLTGWAICGLKYIQAGLFGGFIIVFLMVRWYSLQQRLFRKINYFFEAVKNEDSALSFPNPTQDKMMNQLNHHLQKLNNYLQQLKTETRQHEQYLQAIIEHVDIGIIIFDSGGFILNANKSIKQLLNLRQLTHVRQLKKNNPQLANVIGSIQPNQQKVLKLELNNQKVANLLIKATIFKKGDQTLRLVSMQDINDQLNEKELDSWMKLIRVLTHEIMNSIAPVTSLSENLKNYFIKDGTTISPSAVSEKMIQNTVKGLQVIEQQGTGLLSFVESYRQLTRLPKPNLKPVKICQLTENTIYLHQSAWPAIQISLKCNNPQITILADEKMIARVLVNLIKNAAEAIDDQKEGKISVDISQNTAQKTEVQIKDNGPGITPDLLEDIFVPFFTTREKGSGIGLSLARQIMRMHGGQINVRSIPTKGTVFSLVFPPTVS